jgi:tetratricopeptide (TPR) repeat protein
LKFVYSLRAKPFRAVIAAALTVLLTAAAVNLWAWQHFRQADRLVQRQQFARAYDHYARCLTVWRWSASTWFLAGRTARRAGLYQEAEWRLARAGELQGHAPGASVPLALERLLLQAQSGDVGEVEEVLWGYIRKETPDASLILEALSRGYLRMFRLGTALRCLGMLLEREPEHVEALVMRGWIQEGGGELTGASKDYRRALELDPQRDDARLGLARILLRDSPKEAHSLFEQVLARQPDNPEALVGLAEAWWALGAPEKARPLFDALLAKDPENAKALAGLGALALGAGNATEGEALLRKAIATDPGNVQAQYQLYLCLVQQPGRRREADAQRDEHKRVEADFARLGKIASKEMTRKPNDPDLHAEMGAIYLRYGKPEVGLRWLYSALKLNPTHRRSHQALYEYFKRTGDSARAEQHRLQLDSPTAKQSPGRP